MLQTKLLNSQEEAPVIIMYPIGSHPQYSGNYLKTSNKLVETIGPAREILEKAIAQTIQKEPSNNWRPRICNSEPLLLLRTYQPLFLILYPLMTNYL